MPLTDIDRYYRHHNTSSIPIRHSAFKKILSQVTDETMMELQIGVKQVKIEHKISDDWDKKFSQFYFKNHILFFIFVVMVYIGPGGSFYRFQTRRVSTEVSNKLQHHRYYASIMSTRSNLRHLVRDGTIYYISEHD